MTLTIADTRHLVETFEALRPEVEEASVAFYERLFARAPHLRPLFRDDVANQGMRFMSAVGLIIQRLHEGATAEAELRRLGRGHAAMGVRAADFAPMREALIDTFRDALGARFTPEAEAAWRRAYDDIAAAMIGAGSGT